MRKCRIVERSFLGFFDGCKKTSFTIQRKWLFGLAWEDASGLSSNLIDTFDTLEEAIENLPYFDGTKSINGTKVVYKNY